MRSASERAAWTVAALLMTSAVTARAQDALHLGEAGYLTAPGLDVIVFDDIYPDGHQTGVTVIQQGIRVAANGDLRLDPEPGQWSPMPAAVGKHVVDKASGTVTQALRFPDPDKNGHGFNPIYYPDLDLSYQVHVSPAGGDSFRISVDLDKPLPRQWVGRVGFNLELFPGQLFGKAWLMDGASGIFPRQPDGPIVREPDRGLPVPRNVQANGPVQDPNGQALGAPLAVGRTLAVAPETEGQRLRIESRTGALQLVDGRLAHNNGWFIVRGTVAAGATKGAIEWIVTPSTTPGWHRAPVIQLSQIGYAPAQPKRAVIELDPADTADRPVQLFKLGPDGRREVMAGAPTTWGKFLRYRYKTFDFSGVTDPGMYQVGYGDRLSSPFRIDAAVYSRHAWQPTLEYFLPIQMSHMAVREKYRVWHGLDHMDDARMAPAPINHIDGYAQGPSTLTKFKPGEHVPGLDAGGWHDAGDYDLRIESQIGEVWILSKMIEEFGLDYDATRIDEVNHTVEIHDPDGVNDAVQQIEHGLLTVLGGYRAMGRTYRGIQVPTLRQYALLGEAANETDGIVGKSVAGLGVDNNGNPITADDRWVFTEDNPDRELNTAGGLAAAARVLRRADPKVAAEALAAARDIAGKAFGREHDRSNEVFALAELFQATGDAAFRDRLTALEPEITARVEKSGWMLASVLPMLPAAFRARVTTAVAAYQHTVDADSRTDSPYGVPYKPEIWGAGWTIQERGVHQYFFHKGWPKLTSTDSYVNSLNFVLGAHPGENTASFVSGVGAVSDTTAYGFNRADWSYVPGGVVSGTNLVRPDLPELKVWPFFWQQGEYVLGGGATNYMFLALAADKLYGGYGK
ncbi:MAG: glycoside hydrolase family 9 protein [Janthinobacterium lividum]